MTALAIQHRDSILERMARGEPITKIAHELGYAGHAGITERLGKDPAYKAALKAGIVGKLEKRERELESADSNVAVTRADRLLGHARWWAERLDRETFGDKLVIQQDVSSDLAGQLLAEASKILQERMEKVVNPLQRTKRKKSLKNQ